MTIKFLDEAHHELDETIEYYNNESAGLGLNFLQEVLNALDRIANYPDAWHPLSVNTRRCQTRRFPYGLVYTEYEDHILSSQYLTSIVNHATGQIEQNNQSSPLV